MDVLVAVAGETDHDETADALCAIAYDVMLEHGPVVELHILTEDEFVRSQEHGNPFVNRAVAEGRSHA